MKLNRLQKHILTAVIMTAVWYESGCTSAPVYTSVKKSDIGIKKSDQTNTSQNAGIRITQDQQNAVLKEIQAWMGTPYRFGHCEKGKGTDCSGFVGFIFKNCLNIILPRKAADIYASGKTVKEQDLVFGDLVFLKNTYSGAKGASHVGIYIGDGKMAHASTTEGVTISKLTEKYYSDHLLGYRRVL
jgi:murein DD-endopeptidase / murein LD-carboxypeptidase